MAQLHLVIGPVGAGKSTFALQLCRDHRGIRLTLDAWMARLFRKDRPDVGIIEWYVERTQRCIEQIWKIACDLIEIDVNVVLEIGLIQRHEREAFYQRIDDRGYDLTIYVLDAARDVRRARVAKRNAEHGETFSMEVPPEIFELASDMWQAPTETEREGRDVRFLFTDSGDRDPVDVEA